MRSAYESRFNEASRDIIPKSSIWAALCPDKAGGGQVFNVANQAMPSRVSERWPALANYFGLKGIGPVDDVGMLKLREYIQKHRDILQERGVATSEVLNAGFLDSYEYYLTFDHQLSLGKASSAGFVEEIDPNSS
jgi:hypothetical protein